MFSNFNADCNFSWSWSGYHQIQNMGSQTNNGMGDNNLMKWTHLILRIEIQFPSLIFSLNVILKKSDLFVLCFLIENA